jgi:2',3'-cyclic-nucleotide 2'-phosphodiesterase (5'-nucleotidase family)
MKTALTTTIISHTLLLLGSFASAQESAFSLSILHMNDHHAHLVEDTFTVETLTLPENVTSSINTTEVEEIEVTYGGFPRLISLYRELDEESNNTLKLHAGNYWCTKLLQTVKVTVLLIHPSCSARYSNLKISLVIF